MRIALFIVLLLFGLAASAQGDLGNPSSLARLKAQAAGGGGPSFPQSGSVIHHWALGEASGDRQDSVGTMHMTPVGTVTQTTGKNGNGVDIASASGLTNLVTALDINYPFTVAMWVKSADTTPAATQRLFTTDAGNDVDLLFISSGDTRLQVGGDGDSFPVVALGANDVWHLVVFSAEEASETRLSVDGSTWTVGNSYAGDLNDAGDNIYVAIGCRIFPAFAGEAFVGQIDEVTAWSVALSQQNVTDLWNGGTGTFYTP